LEAAGEELQRDQAEAVRLAYVAATRARRPGLYPPIGERPQIVWWDQAVLALDVEEEISLRQQRILEADPDGTASAASEEDYARWKLAHDEVLARASRPSISVQLVSSASRGAAGDDKVRWRLWGLSMEFSLLSTSTLTPGEINLVL
jgi:hypothetical protein